MQFLLPYLIDLLFDSFYVENEIASHIENALACFSLFILTLYRCGCTLEMELVNWFFNLLTLFILVLHFGPLCS
jgi:hypothetical protein